MYYITTNLLPFTTTDQPINQLEARQASVASQAPHLRLLLDLLSQLDRLCSNTIKSSPVPLFLEPPPHQEEEGIKAFTTFSRDHLFCSQPPRNGVPCRGEVRAKQVCPVKATMPNLSTKDTSTQLYDPWTQFYFLGNASLRLLQYIWDECTCTKMKHSFEFICRIYQSFSYIFSYNKSINNTSSHVFSTKRRRA